MCSSRLNHVIVNPLGNLDVSSLISVGFIYNEPSFFAEVRFRKEPVIGKIHEVDPEAIKPDTLEIMVNSICINLAYTTKISVRLFYETS